MFKCSVLAVQCSPCLFSRCVQGPHRDVSPVCRGSVFSEPSQPWVCVNWDLVLLGVSQAYCLSCHRQPDSLTPWAGKLSPCHWYSCFPAALLARETPPHPTVDLANPITFFLFFEISFSFKPLYGRHSFPSIFLLKQKFIRFFAGLTSWGTFVIFIYFPLLTSYWHSFMTDLNEAGFESQGIIWSTDSSGFLCCCLDNTDSSVW